MRPSIFKRLAYGSCALLASVMLAHAAIDGINSQSQSQQVAVGQMQLGMGTATGNSVTINQGAGIITTAALSTAQNATTAITLTNNRVAVGDMIQCTVDPLTSAGTPFCANARVTAGQIVFNVGNTNAAALNAAVAIHWTINKAGNNN